MRGKIIVLPMILLTTIALAAIFGTPPVLAQPPSIYTANLAQTPTEIFPRVAYGGTSDVYVKIQGTTHLTGETNPDPRYGGANPEDTTWAYGITVTWDPTVLQLDASRVLEPKWFWSGLDPAPDNTQTHRSFLKFAYWSYDYDLAAWLPRQYAVSYATGGDLATGLLEVGMTLTAETSDKPWNTNAIPAEMIPGDPAYIEGCGDEGYHEGTYFDLPYDVTNKYDLLVRLRFKNLDTGGTSGTKWSKIHIEGKLKTIGQADVVLTPYDAWYYQKQVPEFPLGLAPLMILAPAIPIVYLWRIRKRKVR